MSEAAEIEALEESSRNTKVKLLDIGANLRQQIEALEHASRTPEPLAEEPALKRQRHGQGLFPCGCGAQGSTKTLKPIGSFDEDGCGGCTNGHGCSGICGGNYGGCSSCGSCSGPCGCGNCGGCNSNWAGSCGGSCSSSCGGCCNAGGCCGGCCQGGCCTGGCTGCSGPVCGCGGCGNCCGCGGCGNCGCGNGSCGGNCNGCGCPGNSGCGGCGCGCGCGCCGCGSCGGPSLPGCNGCDGMNSMNPMAMMMAAMMGQMMASSRDTTGSTEHSPTKLSKDDEEDTSTYGSSFNVSHPNYRPPDMEHKPGITDKRFIGRIKFWFETKGFGFIESEEFSKVFGGDSDVFLHHFQKRHYQQGDLVEFSVFINFRGKPQGTELRKVKQ